MRTHISPQEEDEVKRPNINHHDRSTDPLSIMQYNNPAPAQPEYELLAAYNFVSSAADRHEAHLHPKTQHDKHLGWRGQTSGRLATSQQKLDETAAACLGAAAAWLVRQVVRT
jgi:hypothetical protein